MDRQKYNLKYTDKHTLHDPVENVRLGTAYLDYLRGRFTNHAQLYISAYNMGKRNVDRNLRQECVAARIRQPRNEILRRVLFDTKACGFKSAPLRNLIALLKFKSRFRIPLVNRCE